MSALAAQPATMAQPNVRRLPEPEATQLPAEVLAWLAQPWIQQIRKRCELEKAEPPRRQVYCANCGGEGRLYTSRYGGNDPDTWCVGRCDVCGGTGLVLEPDWICDCCGKSFHPDTPREVMDGETYCQPCAQEQRYWNAHPDEIVGDVRVAGEAQS